MVTSRLPQYLAYHEESVRLGDVDPGYAMLLYIVKRFELNLEQRYWLAFLYSLTYHGASAFYLYNEFPDFENVDVGRLTRWWFSRGRDETLVQTDRRWVRSSNQLIPAFESYRDWIGSETQAEHFGAFTKAHESLERRYDAVLESASCLYSYGQFALFLYLEALHTITELKLCPTDLDLNKAWSCRNGMYYVYGRDDLVDDTQTPIRSEAIQETTDMWVDLRLHMAQLVKPPTVWQIETVLCAYRKWNRGKRWIGYYLDRMGGDIAKMQARTRRGVCWDVLWEFRKETYEDEVLAEAHGHMTHKGVTKEWREYRIKRTQETVDV